MNNTACGRDKQKNTYYRKCICILLNYMYLYNIIYIIFIKTIEILMDFIITFFSFILSGKEIISFLILVQTVTFDLHFQTLLINQNQNVDVVYIFILFKLILRCKTKIIPKLNKLHTLFLFVDSFSCSIVYR